MNQSFKYSCGHKIHSIIINTSAYTLSTYIEWKKDKNNMCIKCWLKQNKL